MGETLTTSAAATTAASPARRLILCIMGTGGVASPKVPGCIPAVSTRIRRGGDGEGEEPMTRLARECARSREAHPQGNMSHNKPALGPVGDSLDDLEPRLGGEA